MCVIFLRLVAVTRSNLGQFCKTPSESPHSFDGDAVEERQPTMCRSKGSTPVEMMKRHGLKHGFLTTGLLFVSPSLDLRRKCDRVHKLPATFVIKAPFGDRYG